MTRIRCPGVAEELRDRAPTSHDEVSLTDRRPGPK